CARRYYW
nr:immunoglobulin heavy chain junction region [Mus musculus]MBK4196373.1 immunoglobulin heavy chain junction region [Mus musculus]MBK4196374.1 immunoglobulin heavy chain junction region [Mus musculus]